MNITPCLSPRILSYPAMTIELNKQQRADAIASIQRYFEENLSEPIGDLPAGLLPNLFKEEVEQQSGRKITDRLRQILFEIALNRSNRIRALLFVEFDGHSRVGQYPWRQTWSYVHEHCIHRKLSVPFGK